MPFRILGVKERAFAIHAEESPWRLPFALIPERSSWLIPRQTAERIPQRGRQDPGETDVCSPQQYIQW